MGKTAQGAVWLDGNMVTAYDYWQFWRNTEDGDVERFLKFFTVLPLEEIARLAALKGGEINEAKKILATEATALVHGREAAEKAAEAARATFEDDALSRDLPTIEVKRADLEKGLGVLTANVQAGFVSSTSEARRQVKGGGIKVNDVTVTDEKQLLSLNDLTSEGVIKLSFGKKRHALIKPV
jgi:tyrosyl-tRNA synthetase